MDKAEQLINLAKEQFARLGPADEPLFLAVANGQSADYSSPNERENDPATAENWPPERAINADRIIWLCTDKNARGFVNHKGIQVIGARIDGELDLEFAHIPFPLDFEKSRFFDETNLQNAQLPALYLPGTHTGSINADGLTCKGDVFLRYGFSAKGEVNLAGARLGGDLDCQKGQFSNKGNAALSADGIAIKGSAFLCNGFRAKGQVRLICATIGRDLDCKGAEFVNGRTALQADRIDVKGSVFLGDSFRAEGEVRLPGATIGGSFDCSNGQFINKQERALVADDAAVKGSVFLKDDFRVEGEVRLPGATIGGNFECPNAQFINKEGIALAADRADIMGSVFLNKGFKAEGEVRLVGATIRGNLSCEGASLHNKQPDTLSAEMIRVDGHVFLRDNFQAEGTVTFLGAVIKGFFNWRDFKCSDTLELDLRSAKIGTLCDKRKSWPKKGNLFLHGLVYDQIDDEAPTDAKARIDWLKRQPVFSPQPYEQLAAVLKKSGHEADAKKILIEKERTRAATLTWHARIPHAIWGLLIGYGYRPWRAAGIGLAIVLIAWFLFDLGFHENLMRPTKEMAYVHDTDPNAAGPQARQEYPKFNAFVYSLDVFLPLVDLHQCAYWLPNAHATANLTIYGSFSVTLTGSFLRLCFWLEILSGWLITTLLVASLTKLART